jgi:eukaryotic-like serine/threonine-protein kinase
MASRDDDRATIDLGPSGKRADLVRPDSVEPGISHADTERPSVTEILAKAVATAPVPALDDNSDGRPSSASSQPPTKPSGPRSQASLHLAPGRQKSSSHSVHQQATQIQTRSPTRSTDSPATKSAVATSMPGNQSTRYSTTTSPVEAMRFEEMERMRVFLGASILMSMMAIVTVLLLHGDPIAQKVVISGCLLVCVADGWLFQTLKDPAAYTMGRISFGATIVAIGAYAAVYYWGLASPATAMILYGIYFFSLGLDTKVRLFQFGFCVFLHATLSILIVSGTIQDRSLLPIAHLPLGDQIIVCITVEFLYLVAFVTARWSRRSTIDAISRLEQAVRSVAQREAMLAEVRAELDRAIKIGGPGRYSDQVVGSFRLGALIGRGGMGEVYEGNGVTDQREVAVKLLGAASLGDDQYLQRFLREADNAARLDSPYVVRVIEVGATAGELPFIAMERLRGTDLAHQLRRHRKLPIDQVTVLVNQLAAGLETARAANIVHRDLKPQNVFHADDPDGVKRWKILDFGVSKRGGSGTLTKGNVVGTPAYMSPEQASGLEVDHRADVYSLAAIIYRSVTGHPAFTGKDVPTTLYDVVYRVPTQPTMLTQLPTDVDRLLALGLAKKSADRIATATELAQWFVAATTVGLSAAQRRRADAHIEKNPWGTRPLGGADS